MAKRSLTSFYRGFRNRTDSLLSQFSVNSPSPHFEIDRVPVEIVLGHNRSFLVNRLFHLWGEFCRHVVVASALGDYHTLNGVQLSSAPQISSVSDIVLAIKEQSIIGPRLRWGDPTWTVKNLRIIQPVNLQQISLGIGAAPFDEFRRVRNFVIHSNSNTRQHFDRVAFRYSLLGATPDDLLLHRLPGGATIMENWVRAFQDSALEAVR